ncbi:conserved hypothetical protein [Candida tropicalis MYA-3404]|uniref:Tyrosine specific protein phosphatases domain-containing protein n=1 Tax=Candida tropicalis (strain ATCC MYA-3404 / T1) TaxID=294747 RepID=C5M8F1_CANTT|nr:conserved hypothetical protein [Candida tropicalis MYA-3404]EER33855.1 conserved hypothetical protein [Candida tropicalis MYA-3404]KAG4407709.1 hypothetical protein JTP64_003244 [Candida tropicalis]
MANTKYNPPIPREIEVTVGKGVAATLAIPPGLDSQNAFAENLAPATHKAALILHGQGGHRNYCYQKTLAHRLASELGIFSLRIDFRGCGNSAENENELEGRTLAQDVDDIQACAEFLTDGKLNGLGIDLTLSSVISHSRGAVAMFLWAQIQDKLSKQGDTTAIVVPNLINCSSRFTSPTVLDRYSSFADMDFVPVTTFRHGEYKQIQLSAREIISLSKPDLTSLNELSRDWSVLSIYGTEDEIIPKYDCANFANTLNRGPFSHTLRLIPDADHNFYGHTEIAKDSEMSEINPYDLPLKGGKRVNYNFLVTDYIIEYLSPAKELERFISTSKDIGRVSRWKNIEGVSNFRDIGGWRVHSPTFKLGDSKKSFVLVGSDSHSPSDNLVYYVRPHFAFRCANVAGLTSNGLKTLQQLGVAAIFDLRSDGEVESDGYPANLSDYGIKRIHAPVFTNDDYSPQAIAIRYTNLMTCWSTYVNVYEDMLELGTSAYKTIFEYIRDENKPFVFHCTAGKDRTGILGMLILLLSGVDKNTIAKEYELTTVGLKPDHPILKGKFVNTVQKLKEKLGEDANDIESVISQGRKGWSIEEDGFNNLISSRYEAMLATIALFHQKYGNIVNYLKDKLGFSSSDIIKIYENLVIVDPQNIGFEVSSPVNWDHRTSSKAKF